MQSLPRVAEMPSPLPGCKQLLASDMHRQMGHDAMSVVDGSLKAHGIDNLRIADGSIMPRITTGNTMAPCVVIGERAPEILKARHSV
jgi:choline dehydrogenase-like flavoprotein